jgi:DNA-binding NarL/FixJ family response regulator
MMPSVSRADERALKGDGPIKVVIADDEADVRLLVRLSFEHDPRFVIAGEASSGKEALEVLTSCGADAVVLDLHMPEMHGLESLPLIRRRFPHIAIVLFSAYLTGAARLTAVHLGADDAVEKTTAPAELVERMARLFAAA